MEKSRQPSSPGISPVSISDSIEELLKFLLSASANETLEIDLGLSNAYCSYLLTPEPDHGSYHDAVDALQTSGGVPLYPLYKHLASTLHSCITSGAFWRTSNTITSIQEDECLKQKENEWSKLIASEGTELVKMLKVVDFELHVQEPFFTQLRVGLKTIEGRCAVGDYNRIGPGAFLLINKCLLLEVQNVKWYASFSEMMEAASLTRVLPGVETIEEGVQIYRKFYTEEKEKSNGVLAICVSRSAVQPYISMANIVHGLSYNGIGSLMGLMHTAGTVLDSLPPSRSTLLSSFMMPNQPNVEVKGSTLTDGARALAKHVNRSSDGWWGNFGGNVHWVSGAIHEGWPFKGMEALGICCTIFICEKHLMSRKDFLSKLYCVEEGDGPPVGPTIAWK
ncbi:uncharacterized protein LOC131240181 isoform X3 [Magnolia sinica]|uniref:uncharacterized protein LOC131240181 isoform X3 n=1 Tax=Magnolia sinica TaxID=86752 RepID=UPI00265B08A3|nr:uncharacterized protein LOC131240181 isoform X3 [Magnolia sinica]